MHATTHHYTHNTKCAQHAEGERVFADVREFLERIIRTTGSDAKQLFAMLDRNSAGSLNSVDIGFRLRELGLRLSEREVRLLVNRVSGNNTGKIEFNAFEREFRRGLSEESARYCASYSSPNRRTLWHVLTSHPPVASFLAQSTWLKRRQRKVQIKITMQMPRGSTRS